MRCGEINHHVHGGDDKEMAPSSDVNDADKDTDEDESKNSIVHGPFDEPSLENLIMDVSESDCNIVDETLSQSDSSNVTKELNYDDHIKPSANFKEASYFNMFECGRNLLDKLYVIYQRAFAASEKPSSVPPTAYISPLGEKYWDMQAKLLTERMDKMDKDKIPEAVSQIKFEDEAYHERIIANDDS